MKLVVIINEDLGMSCGKLASQAIHATVSLLRGKKPKKQEDKIDKWDSHHRKVVVVRAPLKEMVDVAVKASSRKLHVGPLIKDEGLTEIPPNSITAIALGPDEEEAFAEVSDHLKLV